MLKTFNLNIKEQKSLITPQEVFNLYPLEEDVIKNIFTSRNDIMDILSGKSSRMMLIVGPCSIHNFEEALEYARRLKSLSSEVSDKIILIMRVYFEKPRTTVGWKGLIYDPDLNGSYDIEKGIILARKLILEINKLGVPVATEILDPIITQYISDEVSWAAIGARTTESQTHRQMVSGLSMPVGFKNATNGDIDIAIDAIQAAMSEHSFLGVLNNGQTGIFRTKGNLNSHLILRGGKDNPNYQSEYISYASEIMRKKGIPQNIIIDCSHDNSRKVFEKQKDVFYDILKQKEEGNKSIIGAMLESNLNEGCQKVEDGKDLKPGVSITDACIDWEDTEKLILDAYKVLSSL